MYGRYHPIYESLWNDLKFDVFPDPWLHAAFFAYLCSNKRTAPAGIYRVTPEIVAAEIRRPVEWVAETLGGLSREGLVRVDGGVLWVIKWLARQPNRMGPAYRVAVVNKLKEIGLGHVLVQAFLDSYETLGGPLSDRRLRVPVTVGRPSAASLIPHTHPAYSTEEGEILSGTPPPAEPPSPSPPKKAPGPSPLEVQVIAFLNEQAGTSWKPGKSYGKELRGRIADSYTLEDFEAVVRHKVARWKDDDRFRENLNPTTLFRKSNFERYLVEVSHGGPRDNGPGAAPRDRQGRVSSVHVGRVFREAADRLESEARADAAGAQQLSGLEPEGDRPGGGQGVGADPE